MIVDEASVTVTVVVGGTTAVYELGRVRDFEIETRRDEPPYYRASSRVMAYDPPRSIRFSMRPLANGHGEYVKITHTPEVPRRLAPTIPLKRQGVMP